MRKAVFFLAVLSGLVAAGASAAGQTPKSAPSTGKQTYKWVDEKGVIHYGDHVPAEYSQREQSVLNEQGLEVQKRQAELSPAEAIERAKKQKEEAQRKQHDMFLMSTYPSTREIENVRDTRLDQINAQISAAEAYIDSLTTRVEGLKQRSKMFAPYNKSPGARRLPDDLAEEMVRALSELRTQNSALANRRTEAKAVTEQFDGDIRRFKELRMSAAARLDESNRPKKQ
jgi:chromosome segregation ATPase